MTAVMLLCLLTPPHAGQKDAPPGWPGLLPALPNYGLRYHPPVVTDKAKHYSQMAEYDWLGGADRAYHVTLLRDPGLKDQYAADAVMKGKPAPERLEIQGCTAWHWKLDPPVKGGRPLHAKLVILLGDDRAVIWEMRGLGPFAQQLPVIADKLDLKKARAALDNPPQMGK